LFNCRFCHHCTGEKENPVDDDDDEEDDKARIECLPADVVNGDSKGEEGDKARTLPAALVEDNALRKRWLFRINMESDMSKKYLSR
jgi:hypothetical protein